MSTAKRNLIQWVVFVVIVGITLTNGAIIVHMVENTSREEKKANSNVQEIVSIIEKNIDRTIDPCEDFYRFACGGFVNSTDIPDGSLIVSPFSITSDEIRKHEKSILEEPSLANEPKYSLLSKNLYKTCMNQTAIEIQGLEPLRKIINQLGGWPVLEGDKWNQSQFDWIEFYLKTREMGYSINYFLEIGITPDYRNSSRQILFVNHGSTSLDSSYFQKNNTKILQAYLNYSVDIAEILGAKRSFAEKELREAQEFEKKLNSIPLAENKIINQSDVYNLMSISELTKNYSSIPWKKYFNRLLPLTTQVDNNEKVMVTLPNYIKNLETLMNNTDKRILANYMVWRVVKESIWYLSENVRKKQLVQIKARFENYKRPLRSIECVDQVANLLPLSVASRYIRKYFDKDSKNKALKIVIDIQNQLYQSLVNASWMDQETKKHALEKADLMMNHVAYPDELLNDFNLEEYYKDLELVEESFLENQLRIKLFKMRYSFSQFRKPVDKKNWITTAASTLLVNAVYIQQENTIECLTGILQGVFFGKDRPAYMNYGAIGSVIGHEITHGFDYTGKQFDKDGNLVNWWSSLADKSYNEKAQCIMDQYGNYTIKGINETLDKYSTIGENIADFGGIKLAYLAYLNWTNINGPEEKLSNLKWSPKQLFWISAANARCSVMKKDVLKFMLNTDEHGVDEFRVFGPFSNMPQFAEDFNCKSGSRMNPEKKCSLW